MNQFKKVLSNEQNEFFDEKGYLIIEDCVSERDCNQTIAEVWGVVEKLFGVECDKPETWHHDGLHVQGFLDIFALDSMWANRQNPKLYEAFADILGTPELWVSNDRVGWKRPAHYTSSEGQFVDMFKAWQRKKPHVHTDCNHWFPPKRLEVQGILALSDSPVERGGFACIPGFHKVYEQWAADNIHKAVPERKKFVTFKDPALIRQELQPIPLKRGDLLIFNSLLPHATTPNRSDEWRQCQYITFFRALPENRSKRSSILSTYSTGEPPSQYPSGSRAFRGRVNEEARAYRAPELTKLGRKIVGLDDWQAQLSLNFQD